MAWENHFTQFAAFDEDKIMADYDADSVVAVYNDACEAPNQNVAEYTGLTEIKGMFTTLFDALGRDLGNVDVKNFTAGGGVNPHCEPNLATDTTLPATSNVFLVWSAAGQGITYATDTFTWKTGYKVKKQNIVVTEPGGQCVLTVAPPDGAPGPIKNGWDNHFEAFGAKNVTKILDDYTEESVIRIWDNTNSGYSTHAGLDAIGTMFTGLFAAITGASEGDPLSDGVGAPLVSVTPQFNSVFLVWKSFSNPKATDTFIFDDAGKIVRQNIATSSKATAQVVALV